MTPERREQVGQVAQRLLASAERNGPAAAFSSAQQVARLGQVVRASTNPAQFAKSLPRVAIQPILRTLSR